MSLKHLSRLAFTALFVAWCFDQLFWRKSPGISFFLFVILCLLSGGFLTWGEGLRPAKWGLALLLPVLLFSGMTFLRQEPFTLLLDYSLTLGCMAILALTWMGGRWRAYSLEDYVVNGLRLVGDIFILPLRAYLPSRGKAGEGDSEAQAAALPAKSSYATGPRPLLSVFFGLLLALPALALLAALLAQADLVFSQRLQGFLEFLSIDQLPEYIFRLTYIVAGAYLLVGVYLYALLSSRNEKLRADQKTSPSVSLGWVEAVTILTSIDLLFAFFVAIQFRYLFGGQGNITTAGFTYAEYARRGFSELAVVAFFSLLIFLGLGMITSREKASSRRAFSAAGIGLVSLVTLILVSAYQRLLLYEAAYGFSRIRTYTHVFLVWLGVLLVATMALELSGQLKRFALAALLVSLSFGLTLNVLNVDGWIAKENTARAVQGSELDTVYLVNLSDDAVPALVDLFQSGRLPPLVRDRVGAVLACRSAIARENSRPTPWPSYQWSRQQALSLYRSVQEDLNVYNPRKPDGLLWVVQVGGREIECGDWRGMMD